jgi:hypothetical protein
MSEVNTVSACERRFRAAATATRMEPASFDTIFSFSSSSIQVRIAPEPL